jgi:hypothetical protein
VFPGGGGDQPVSLFLVGEGRFPRACLVSKESCSLSVPSVFTDLGLSWCFPSTCLLLHGLQVLPLPLFFHSCRDEL